MPNRLGAIYPWIGHYILAIFAATTALWLLHLGWDWGFCSTCRSTYSLPWINPFGLLVFIPTYFFALPFAFVVSVIPEWLGTRPRIWIYSLGGLAAAVFGAAKIVGVPELLGADALFISAAGLVGGGVMGLFRRRWFDRWEITLA